MKNSTSLFLIGLSCIFGLADCSRSSSQLPVSMNAVQTSSPVMSAETKPSIPSNQSIRLMDFGNVSYPHYPVYTENTTRYVTLKAGEGKPAMLNYGDVTGDGIEEAMMVLGIESRGSAIPEIVYVFGLKDGQPRLLWYFETGDRADGGLRQVFADHGELVVELFGKDRIVGGKLYQGDEALAGPKSFTRARYEWSGNTFRLKGTPEVLANPSNDANSVMPYYSGPSK